MGRSRTATKPNARRKVTRQPGTKAETPTPPKPLKKKGTQPQKGARETSKLATVIAMLRSPKGATIEELMKATGWQQHSVRGAISGAIKKKLALLVTSAKADGVRKYRIDS